MAKKNLRRKKKKKGIAEQKEDKEMPNMSKVLVT